MISSTLADLNDKFFQYKRQTYLFAFPVGIVICILYILGSPGNSTVRTYVSYSMIAELGLFIVLLIFWPRLMRWIEYILYISFTATFFLVSQLSIDTYRLNGSLSPMQLADVLNSLSMWLIVFLLGAYLTTSKAYVRLLIGFIFLGMTIMAVNNLLFLSSSGLLEITYLFRWANVFTCFLMAALLIQRMGVLQQSLASTDPLTGLVNRRALYQSLTREMGRSTRYRKPLSVVLVDVDHFKNINDTYGHIAGDNVLKAISGMMSGAIRQVDYAGRWGGEEFLLILPETDSDSAVILAKRICQLVAETRYGKVDHVTASLGVTIYQDGQLLEDLLHRADQAMYLAKKNGRNRVMFYAGEETAKAAESDSLARGVNDADELTK
jgi:diguanylate cyclase (GGDEF)-like protein